MVKFEKGLVVYKSHSGAEFDLSEANVLSDDAHPTPPDGCVLRLGDAAGFHRS